MNAMTQSVLLHGWATNRAVFDDFLPRLQGFSCRAQDLAGHGQAKAVENFMPEKIADEIACQYSQVIHVFGWSLGGYIALLMAYRHPEKIKTLTLCSSFSRFSMAEDYPCGQPNMTEYAQKLAGDYLHQIKNFMQMQALSAPKNQDFFFRLPEKIIQAGIPTAILVAHDAIMNADARNLLSSIHTPTLILYGEKDRLTPPAMSHYLASHLPNAQIHGFAKSAHMPFVSEASTCSQIVLDFWNSHA